MTFPCWRGHGHRPHAAQQPTRKGMLSFGFMAQPHPQIWSCAQFKSTDVFIRKSFHHTVKLPIIFATSDVKDEQRMQDMPSWWGNSQGCKTVKSGNSSPYEIPNSSPCNERPPSVRRRYASTWSRWDCRGKGTAPAGSRAREHGGHPCVREEWGHGHSSRPSSRGTDTHTLVLKHRESRGLQPPHQLHSY